MINPVKVSNKKINQEKTLGMKSKDFVPGVECPFVFSFLTKDQKKIAISMKQHFTPKVAAEMLKVRAAVVRAIWGNPCDSFVIAEKKLELGFKRSKIWYYTTIPTSQWFLEFVEACPPEWLPQPQDIKGWRMFRNTVKAMENNHVVPYVRSHDKNNSDFFYDWQARLDARKIISKLIRNSGREWVDFYNFPIHIAAQADDTSIELGYDLISLMYMQGSIPSCTLISVDQIQALGSCFLYHSRSAKSIYRIIQAYHQRLVPQMGQIGENWNPLYSNKPWESSNGMEIYEILNKKSLVLEGEDMNHCIGSYSANCTSGYGRAFSIRSNGNKNSTAYLGINQKLEVVIKQHVSKSNRAPSSKSVQALKEFIEVNQNKFEKNVLTRKCSDTSTNHRVEIKTILNSIFNGHEIEDRLAIRWERWRAILDVAHDPYVAIQDHFDKFPWSIGNLDPFVKKDIAPLIEQNILSM